MAALPSRPDPGSAPASVTPPDGRRVDRWKLADGTGISAHVLTYGAVLQALSVPGPDGRAADVVLGFDNLGDYVERSPYFGCVVGRYANRIAGGRFALAGRRHRLPVNDADRPNTLHGGPDGFHRRLWTPRPLAVNGVELSLLSQDGDQGFPGRLHTTVRYTLADGALRIDYRAVTDAPTVVNLTNHSYFNLAGEGSGTIDDHVLTLAASAYLPVDADLIPLPEVAPTASTPFDFSAGGRFGARLDEPHEQLKTAGGFDHCFVLDGGRRSQPRRVCVLSDPDSGRSMRLHTTEPGIQIYTGHELETGLIGTSGRAYDRARRSPWSRSISQILRTGPTIRPRCCCLARRTVRRAFSISRSP